MLARVGSVVLVVVVMVAAPRQASAVDRAEELQARQAFASGRYDQALELFAKLYAETLHPVYLRNIGRCHQKMREPQKAIDAFRDYLAKSKKISADERKEIDGYIHEMEALRTEQDKEKAQARPVEPLPPQPTTATPPGSAAPSAQSTVLAATSPGTAPPSTAPVTLTAAPPAPAASHPFYTRWWFWTAVGAVVAGGVVAAVLLSSGGSRPACPAGTSGGCQ